MKSNAQPHRVRYGAFLVISNRPVDADIDLVCKFQNRLIKCITVGEYKDLDGRPRRKLFRELSREKLVFKWQLLTLWRI